MDKFAMLKEAEVSGVLAAFTDAGVMEPLAAEDFDYLTEKVAASLDDTYTVEDIALVADQLLSGGQEKTAEDMLFGEIAPVLGTACMAKVAGEINDAEFEGFVNDFLSEYFG